MTKFSLLSASALALVSVTASAFAADLPYRRQAPDLYAAPPVFTGVTWTGLYVGGNLGWRMANFNPIVNSLEIEGKSRHSLVGGGHVGYNYQVSPNIVLGVEGDMHYGGGEARGPSVPTAFGVLSSRSAIGWAGSVRGRLGYTQGAWMVYGTGGLAFADLEVQASLATPGSVFTSTNDKWAPGYTVGAGLEYMVTQNISVRGEYLYADYGRHTVSVPQGGQTSVEVDSHTARAGVSYKF